MDTLPEEILELIFSYISPYKDYGVASCVCKKWHRILQGIIRNLPENFEQNCNKGKIEWFSVDEGQQITSVTARSGQASCYNDFARCMFVFGGRSVVSTGAGFNDLLRLDLNSLVWERPPVTGSIPPPKYGCLLESYKHYLILFGGSSLPPSNSLHRGTSEFSNDLHVYDIKTGIWNRKAFLPDECPPEIYLPKSCIITDDDDPEMDIMILYGGQKKSIEEQPNKEIWSLNLNNWSWEKQRVITEDPSDLFLMETSRTIFCQLNSPSYPFAILVLSQTVGSVTAIAWFMYRTGFAEWTCRKLNVLNEKFGLFSAFYPNMPFLKIGNTLMLFRNACAQDCIPSISSIPKPKCLKSIVKHLSPQTKGKVVTQRVSNAKAVRSSRHAVSTSHHSLSNVNHFSLPTLSRLLYIYLVNLKDIESEGELKFVDQLDSNHKKMIPSFIGLGVPYSVTAVMGRGEVILHGFSKSGSQSSMSLFIIRGQK